MSNIATKEIFDWDTMMRYICTLTIVHQSPNQLDSSKLMKVFLIMYNTVYRPKLWPTHNEYNNIALDSLYRRSCKHSWRLFSETSF